MAKRVVVTGASGHIGFHVAMQLLELQFEITLLIRKENLNITRLKNAGAQIFYADFKNPESYKHTLREVDALFQIASENTTNTSNEKNIIDNTYGLTKSIIDAAISENVKTIIYTSSVVVLGRSSNPSTLINENNKASFLESPYVKGKFLAEQYCEKVINEKDVDIRRMYPSWVVGDSDVKLTPPQKIILNYVKKGQWFYFGGGISVADVKEVAKAHVNAWLKGRPNEKYVVAGNNISFKQFYCSLAKACGYRKPIVCLPKWIIYTGSVISKILFAKKNTIHPKYVTSIVRNYSWYNSEKAIKELNYSILPTDEIISNAVIDARRKLIGLDKLIDKKNQGINRINYEADDVLLITGFPGWLGIRMVDIMINADRFGNNAVNRKIKLLIQPEYKNLVSPPSSIEIIYGDLTDIDSLKKSLKDVKTVYHLAGVVYPKNIDTYYKVNYQGTKNLAESCISTGVRRILFMSSDSICGYGRKERIFNENTKSHPYKDYGKSKFLAEKYILDKTKEGLLDGTSLRGFWFFGPFMPERNRRFFRMFYGKRQIVFGNGKNFRSISHIDNITQAFIKAEKEKNTIGKWYWTGDKKADSTVDEIYENIAAGLDVTYKPFYIPKWMCEIINLADTLISLTGKVNPSIHAAGKFYKDIAGEITAAQRDFDYKPNVGFEEIKKEINEDITKSA